MFSQIQHNPTYQQTTHYLRQHHANQTWQWLALIPVFVVVIYHMIRFQTERANNHALFLPTLIVLLTYWLTVAHTLYLATKVGRLKIDTDLLTGISPKSIIWGKWWAVIHHRWKVHGLVMLSQLMIIWMLGRYICSVFLSIPLTDAWEHIHSVADAFYPYLIGGEWFLTPPLFLQMLFVSIVLSLLGIMLLGFWVTLGLFIGLRNGQPRQSYFIIFIIGLLMLQIMSLSDNAVWNLYRSKSIRDVIIEVCKTNPYDYRHDKCSQSIVRTGTRVAHSVHDSASTFIDGGVSLGSQFTYQPYYPSNSLPVWSTIRNLIVALVSGLSYLVVIRLLMRQAIRYLDTRKFQLAE